MLCCAFSPDKQLLAAGAMDGTVAVWNLASGGQLLHMAGLKGHHKPVRSLAFTPGELLQVLDVSTVTDSCVVRDLDHVVSHLHLKPVC